MQIARWLFKPSGTIAHIQPFSYRCVSTSWETSPARIHSLWQGGGGLPSPSRVALTLLSVFPREHPPTGLWEADGTAALVHLYLDELPEELCVWPAGWNDGALPKPSGMWFDAEKQGDFYPGRNANPLQVSVSRQPPGCGDASASCPGLRGIPGACSAGPRTAGRCTGSPPTQRVATLPSGETRTDPAQTTAQRGPGDRPLDTRQGEGSDRRLRG